MGQPLCCPGETSDSSPPLQWREPVLKKEIRAVGTVETQKGTFERPTGRGVLVLPTAELAGSLQRCLPHPHSCGFLLRDRFLLDHNFQMRRHILVQLHRHGELAQGLQRLVELDLLPVQIDSLFHDGIGNVAGGDRAE